MTVTLESRQLRIIMARLLPTSSEFDAFVIDYFPDSYKVFAEGLDRIAKTNLLFLREDKKSITAALQKAHPDFMALIISDPDKNKIGYKKLWLTSFIIVSLMAIFFCYTVIEMNSARHSLASVDSKLDLLSHSRADQIPPKQETPSTAMSKPDDVTKIKEAVIKTIEQLNRYNGIHLKRIKNDDFSKERAAILAEQKNYMMLTIYLLSALPDYEINDGLCTGSLGLVNELSEWLGPSDNLWLEAQNYIESAAITPLPQTTARQSVELLAKKLSAAQSNCQGLRALYSDEELAYISRVEMKCHRPSRLVSKIHNDFERCDILRKTSAGLNASLVAHNPTDGINPTDAINQATAELRNGNYSKAIRFAKLATDSTPDLAWRVIGEAACHSRDIKLANDAYLHLKKETDRWALTVVCRPNMSIGAGSDRLRLKN